MGYLLYGLLSLGAGAAALVAAVYLQPLCVMHIVSRLFPRVLWRVSSKRGANGKKVVALTIDDAPRHGASEILDLLQEHGFHATWFIIESYGQSKPSYQARLAGEPDFTLASTHQCTAMLELTTVRRTERGCETNVA